MARGKYKKLKAIDRYTILSMLLHDEKLYFDPYKSGNCDRTISIYARTHPLLEFFRSLNLSDVTKEYNFNSFKFFNVVNYRKDRVLSPEAEELYKQIRVEMRLDGIK